MLGFAMTFTGRINGHRSILQARATPAIRLYPGDCDSSLAQDLCGCGLTHEEIARESAGGHIPAFYMMLISARLFLPLISI